MATKLYNLKFKKKGKLIQKGGAQTSVDAAVKELLRDEHIGKCFYIVKVLLLTK